MNKYFRILWFCAIFVEFPLPAQADVEEGTHVDQAIVASLMSWVENELGIKVPVLPQVIASRSHFDKVLNGMNARLAGRPQSVYVPGKIYMDSTRWDPEEPVQLSLLVHELVHHAQMFMTNKAWPCRQAKEEQAYNLQNRWLEQQGYYPFVNSSWIKYVSSCPDNRSPILLAQH